MAVVAVGRNDLVAFTDGHLHAHHHGLLADVEVAEAADQPHAVKLGCPLLEAADQQHLAIGLELLVATERGTVCWPLGRDMRGALDLRGGMGLKIRSVQETRP